MLPSTVRMRIGDKKAVRSFFMGAGRYPESVTGVDLDSSRGPDITLRRSHCLLPINVVSYSS